MVNDQRHQSVRCAILGAIVGVGAQAAAKVGGGPVLRSGLVVNVVVVYYLADVGALPRTVCGRQLGEYASSSNPGVPIRAADNVGGQAIGGGDVVGD